MNSLMEEGDRWAVPALIPDVPEAAFRFRCFGAADDEAPDRSGPDEDYVLAKRPRFARVTHNDTLIPRRITCPEEASRRQLIALSWLQRGVHPGQVRVRVDADARLGVVPSVAVLHNLAVAYIREGQHRMAGSIIAEMGAAGCGPRPNTFRLILEALLQPLEQFAGQDANKGVVSASARILEARRANDGPALPPTATVAQWSDWYERVVEAAAVALRGFTGLHTTEEAAATLATLGEGGRDGRASMGCKGSRTAATPGKAVAAAMLAPIFWEVSCLILFRFSGSTPQMQSNLFVLSGLVLGALTSNQGVADAGYYNQRYLGVCMRAGRFVQACSLLQSSSSLSLTTVDEFLNLCTVHCIARSAEEGWPHEITENTVQTWGRILVQLRGEAIHLAPTTLLRAVAICFAPMTMEDPVTADQVALLVSTVVAWSRSGESPPAALLIVYRIALTAFLRFTTRAEVDEWPEATLLEVATELAANYAPAEEGGRRSPIAMLRAWLDANVEGVAQSLAGVKIPLYKPCVGLGDVVQLLDTKGDADSVMLAAKQMCSWLPQAWRFFLQGAKDHHRPTLHGVHSTHRVAGPATTAQPTSLPDLLDQLFLRAAFKQDMLAPIPLDAPDVGLVVRTLSRLLPTICPRRRDQVAALLHHSANALIHSVMYRAMLRLSSGERAPTPEVCVGFGGELSDLMGKNIGSVDVTRGGMDPEEIAAMLTVSRVEGSAASTSGFYVMVPDHAALEQLAPTLAAVAPEFNQQNDLLVRAQFRRSPQAPTQTQTHVPMAPLSPGLEAFSSLMRKYSVATGAVLAVPISILASLSDLAVYGLVQLLKAKRVMWVSVLPLGTKTVVAPALPSYLSIVERLEPLGEETQATSEAAWAAGMCAVGGCAKAALLTGVAAAVPLVKDPSMFTPSPAAIHLAEILAKLGVKST